MNPNIQRAQLLIQQSRYELALKELRQALVTDPDDPVAHALLALCLSEQKKLDEAQAAARRAAHLAPDLAYAHLVLGHVLAEQNNLTEAENTARTAIQLAPRDADNFALLARVKYRQKQWNAALAAAEKGLAVEAEHANCQNLRALALAKLGREDEASQVLQTALAQDPENAVTHANQGWTLLQNGEHEKALESFREALRLEPSLAWARDGMIEALRARYLIYRLMLKYFFWMSRLSTQAQWAVIIGLYFASKFFQSLSRSTPELAPLLLPLNYLYLAFAFLTWTAQPLFNLLLRFNRFGRMLLSKRQIMGSNAVAACLALALACLGAWAWTHNAEWFFSVLVFATMAMPVAAAFGGDEEEPPAKTVIIGAAVLAMLGVFAVALTLVGKEVVALYGLYFIGIFIYGWIVNAVNLRR